MELLKIFVREKNEVLIVDHDVITLSNLNRLFMFTREDLGKYKAQRAAELVNSKYKCCAKFFVGRIEDIPIEAFNGYSVLVGALDSVEGRMNLNLMFRKSCCSLLLDCGISGYKAHVKAVRKDLACLYCIKNLYVNQNDVNMCSQGQMYGEITPENRENALKFLVVSEKSKAGNKLHKVKWLVNQFNKTRRHDVAETTVFEVLGLYDEILPNVCFINSICASLAYGFLKKMTFSFDFIFYNGEENLLLTRLLLEKDKRCIVCSEKQSRCTE